LLDAFCGLNPSFDSNRDGPRFISLNRAYVADCKSEFGVRPNVLRAALSDPNVKSGDLSVFDTINGADPYKSGFLSGPEAGDI
jgi:hypothetical protein